VIGIVAELCEHECPFGLRRANGSDAAGFNPAIDTASRFGSTPDVSTPGTGSRLGAERAGERSGACVDAELLEDVLQVRSDRSGRDHELVGDLAVGQALADEA
jgi:hypothetical protein